MKHQFEITLTDLGIHGGIPVTVVKDDRVTASQVHAHSTAARGQDEDKDLWIGVEALHQDLALLRLCCSI